MKQWKTTFRAFTKTRLSTYPLQAASLKVVNIFPKNAKDNLDTAPAQVLLIDGKTGIIQAILDGTYLTQLRTGAASGLAFELLARKDARTGCLIGTGSQAKEQLAAMLATRKLEIVKVYSPNFKRARKFVDAMQNEFKSYDTKIILTDSSDEAVMDADVIVCVTSAIKPVFDGTKVKEGATISCVGSYLPHMQEIDPVILKRASKIFFDSKDIEICSAFSCGSFSAQVNTISNIFLSCTNSDLWIVLL